MDRPVPFAFAVACLLVPLVGCLGTPEAPAARTPRPLAEDAPLPPPPVVDAPAWSQGDAWALVSDGDGGGASTVVVTAAGSDGYVLSTTDEGSAIYDALNDVSFLGRIRASDLAGHQNGQPVQFFSFPLSDGKTWQTSWDGHNVGLRATWVPALQTSVGIHPGFQIEGRVNGEPYVTYDYVPELRWWSHISFGPGYGLKVQRAFVNWTGSYLATETTTLLERNEALPNAGTFTVAEGQAALSLRLEGTAGTPWARALLLLDPSGQPYLPQTSTVVTGNRPFVMEERLPPAAGEWRMASPVLQSEGNVHLLVRQVKLEERTLA